MQDFNRTTIEINLKWSLASTQCWTKNLSKLHLTFLKDNLYILYTLSFFNFQKQKLIPKNKLIMRERM